jgi:hypothetical protein
MKVRDDSLEKELDTDDEDYQGPEDSFICPRVPKRKRSLSDKDTNVQKAVDLSGGAATNSDSNDTPETGMDFPANQEENSEPPGIELVDEKEAAPTEVPEQVPQDQQSTSQQNNRRGVIGTLFPFLL